MVLTKKANNANVRNGDGQTSEKNLLFFFRINLSLRLDTFQVFSKIYNCIFDPYLKCKVSKCTSQLIPIIFSSAAYLKASLSIILIK